MIAGTLDRDFSLNRTKLCYETLPRFSRNSCLLQARSRRVNFFDRHGGIYVCHVWLRHNHLEVHAAHQPNALQQILVTRERALALAILTFIWTAVGSDLRKKSFANFNNLTDPMECSEGRELFFRCRSCLSLCP